MSTTKSKTPIKAKTNTRLRKPRDKKDDITKILNGRKELDAEIQSFVGQTKVSLDENTHHMGKKAAAHLLCAAKTLQDSCTVLKGLRTREDNLSRQLESDTEDRIKQDSIVEKNKEYAQKAIKELR